MTDEIRKIVIDYDPLLVKQAASRLGLPWCDASRAAMPLECWATAGFPTLDEAELRRIETALVPALGDVLAARMTANLRAALSPAAATSAPSRRARRWADEFRRWLAAGSPVRDETEVERIIRECCLPCPHVRKRVESGGLRVESEPNVPESRTPNPDWQLASCDLCGCHGHPGRHASRVRMATSRCPMQPPKWREESGRWLVAGGQGSVASGQGAENKVPSPTGRGQGEGGIDVVIPLGSGSQWDDNELRYLLRSIEKNFLDLGRVFVVGRKPDWLIGVEHIPMDDVHKHNKDANLIDKVLAACRAGVSERFVWTCDDHLFLRPIRFAEMKPLHYSDLAKVTQWREGTWWNRLRATRDALVSRGMTAWNFDVHAPQPIVRGKFIAAAEAFDYAPPPGMTINTMYFNCAGETGISAWRHKYTAEAACNDAVKIRQGMQGKTYLCYNDAGLTDAMKQVIEEMFPQRSRFEKMVYQPVGLPLMKTQDAKSMKIWSLWEGPKPPFIELCLEILLKHNPDAQILDMAAFRRLQTFDCDVELSHLKMANQADWIRLHLLKAFGGIWIDADCIVMRPLNRFLDALRCCWSMAFYEPEGLIGGGFMGTPPDSYHINEMYDYATQIVRSGQPIKWRQILGSNMQRVLESHGWQGFLKLDWHQFIPMPFHRKWGKFFVRGTDDDHASNFNEEAYTYMLSHNSFPKHLRRMTRKELLEGDFFISYVFRRAMA
jgi:hypothetical protein